MVSFKNAIIILTSNLGSSEIYRESAAAAARGGKAGAAGALAAPKPAGKGMKELVMDEVRKHFKPEFVNRIDEFIIFDALRSGSWVRSIDPQLHISKSAGALHLMRWGWGGSGRISLYSYMKLAEALDKVVAVPLVAQPFLISPSSSPLGCPQS